MPLTTQTETPLNQSAPVENLACAERASGGSEAIVPDITMQRASQDRLSETDPLTGLANYRKLSEILEWEVRRSGRSSSPFSVLVFDLGGLQEIADRHGPAACDRALCRLANIFLRSCRSIDTPARCGDHEFAVILPETGGKEAGAVARRICEALANDGEEPLLWATAAIAAYPEDGATMETLLQAAAHAIDEMKEPRKTA